MRRTICLLLVLALGWSCAGDRSQGVSLDEMEEAFRRVPEDTQLAVYWYWISDNISKEGVIADLEAMKEAGINRAFIGNIGISDIAYGPHKVLSDEWWEITHAALKKAGELDIEIGIFNSPGWSQSGGPWVKTEESMRYLASSALDVTGPEKYSGALPVVGDDAQDVKVIAYRIPDARPAVVSKRVTKKTGEELTVPLTMPDGAKARSLSLQVDGRILTAAHLYAEEGGRSRLIKDIELDRSNTELNVGFVPLSPVVISIPESDVRDYRLVIDAPGSADIDVVLSSEPMVERYPEKTLAKMFQTPLPMWDAYMWDEQPGVDPSLVVDLTDVVDLTANFTNGRLEWDVPEGNWRVLRTAMRTTGVTNAPASPEATGLEIDKMSKKHVATHFDAFIGEILRRIPAEDRRTFRVVVEDSYETGGQNWTDDMAERFEEVYGYDPTPFIPVLYGTVVGSPDISDRFLWDLRRLIADRVSYDYVGGLREVSNRHGLTTWLENYGHWGFPGEFLQYGGQSDEIAGEYWSEGTLGDIENKAASSAGHIYGKNKIWAECFTAAGNTFGRYPYLMKQRGDRFFTEGINSVLLHVYIHQPYEDRLPGMNAWFGNEFNRKNTWYGHLRVFNDYLKRATYMLQQGRYIADVAYFIGEDAPKMTGECDPALPKGYSFDYINAEVLMNHARVRDGKLVLDSGMEYAVLVLPRQSTMRPELLGKIDAMVREGLVILGPAPASSPSYAGYPEADRKVETLAGELWNGVAADGYARVGKGYVFGADTPLDRVLSEVGVSPDFYARTNDNILFIHREVTGGDMYFVSNQEERPVKFDAVFRTGYGRPELWDAITGEVRALPEYTENEETVTVPLEFESWGSCFVVFRGHRGAETTGGANFPMPASIATVGGPWQVTFDGLGAPEVAVTFNTLTDWTTSDDPAVKYFSGSATYRTGFEYDGNPSDGLYLDLGHVMVTAKVWVNGEYAGGAWTYPYRVNISELVKEGTNELRVEVANNWKNRLVGDALLPQEQRTTWSPVNPWDGASTLQSSGLMGPVTVVSYDYEYKK